MARRRDYIKHLKLQIAREEEKLEQIVIAQTEANRTYEAQKTEQRTKIETLRGVVADMTSDSAEDVADEKA